MQNIKLFLILKSLSQSEIKELGKFVSSPFHNSNKTLLKFYNLLKSKYPDFASRTLEMETLYKKLFPAKTYSPGVMRNLVSEMIRITESFLAFKAFRNDKHDYYIHLLNQLKTRGIEKLFEKSYNEALDHLNNSPIRDDIYYHYKYLLESIYQEFYWSKLPVGKNSSLYSKYTRQIDSLKYSFFIGFLKENFSVYNLQFIYNFKYDFKFLNEIMEHISKNEDEYKNVPMINILKSFLLLLFEDEDQQNVLQLKEIIDNNRSIMTHRDYRDFYMELLNYYKNKQSAGDKNAGIISFNLNKEMLERDIYLAPGENIPSLGYVNTCTNALRVNEVEWAEKFTNKYRNRLLPKQQLNAYLYNYACIHYIKGKNASNKKEKEKHYNKVLEYLAKVKNEDFFYMTRIKNLQF